MTDPLLAIFAMTLVCLLIWDRGLRNAVIVTVLLFGGFYLYDSSPKGSGVIAGFYQELRQTLG